MRGEEEGSEGERQLIPPTFYTLEQQTQSNKETNKNKQGHLIDRSSFYHMGKEDNRTASMRSCAQQCTVISLSHGKGEQ